MITRLNLDCIATAYPYEYRAFNEAYSAFDDKYSPAGELGEKARFAANAATNPDYRIDDEDDAAFVKAIKDIIDRFANDGIRVFPAVLDSETQFELFFGVENPTRELLDLMGDKVVTEEYEDSPDIFVAW
jgi:hypothetical protein